MQHLEGSGTPVLYIIGRTVLKGQADLHTYYHPKIYLITVAILTVFFDV